MSGVEALESLRRFLYGQGGELVKTFPNSSNPIL